MKSIIPTWDPQVLVALKLAAPGREKDVTHEAVVLSRLSHPRIIGLHSVFPSDDDPSVAAAIATEICEGGSLGDWLVTRRSRAKASGSSALLPFQQRLDIAYQVSSAKSCDIYHMLVDVMGVDAWNTPGSRVNREFTIPHSCRCCKACITHIAEDLLTSISSLVMFCFEAAPQMWLQTRSCVISALQSQLMESRCPVNIVALGHTWRLRWCETLVQRQHQRWMCGASVFSCGILSV